MQKDQPEYVDESFEEFYNLLITDFDKAVESLTPYQKQQHDSVKAGAALGFSKKGRKATKVLLGFYKPPRRMQPRRYMTIHDSLGKELIKRVKKTMNPWTVTEDRILSRLVIADIKKNIDGEITYNGVARWSKYAKETFFGGRSAKECKQRWYGFLDPSIEKKGEWLVDEKIALVKSLITSHKMGVKFAFKQASLDLDGKRTAESCRHRWTNMVKIIADRNKMAKEKVTPEFVLNLLTDFVDEIKEQPKKK